VVHFGIRAPFIRFILAVAVTGGLLVAPAATAASSATVSFSAGPTVTDSDILQFDQRWMQPADMANRLADYDWHLRNRLTYEAWGIGEETRAMVQMYEVTHQRRYLDQLRAVDELVLNSRDDRNPGGTGLTDQCMRCTAPFVDKVRGKVEPAWGGGSVTEYVAWGGLTPVDLVISGVYAYGLAAFSRIVAEDPSLQAAYGDDAMKFANAAIETAMVFSPEFKLKGLGAGNYPESVYYSPLRYPSSTECQKAMNAATKWATSNGFAADTVQALRDAISTAYATCVNDRGPFSNKPMSINESGSMISVNIELFRTVDTQFYMGSPLHTATGSVVRSNAPQMAARFQRYFFNRLQLVNDSAQGQRYTWLYAPDLPRVHTEDTGHSNFDMVYVDVLRRAQPRLDAIMQPLGEPIALDNTALRRFANGFLQMIARPDEIDAGANMRSNLDGRDAADNSRGPDDNNYSCDGWTNMSVVDATVYRMCAEVGLRTLPDVSPPQPYLGIGLHAALLRNKAYWRSVYTADLNALTGAPQAAGDPFGFELVASAVQDVIFRATNGQLCEMWRTSGGQGSGNLTGTTHGPAAADKAVAYYVPGLSQLNMPYTGVDGHAHVMWWAPGGVGQDDFTSLMPGVPGPASNLASYVVPGTILQNVVYRSSDGHLHIMWWTTGGLGHTDLTTATGTPLAVGDPIAYVNTVNTVQHVIFRAIDSHLYDLSWSGASPFSAIDLTVASGAAAAQSDPIGLASPSGLNNVWFYGYDGHLHGLWWTTNAQVGHDDLSWAAGGAPLPASKPAAYFNSQDATYHVVYKSSNNHLHELAWTTGAVIHTDLTTLTHTAVSVGDPAGYVFSVDQTQHVVYRDGTGMIRDLYWFNFAPWY
jgi:hypothetical protein